MFFRNLCLFRFPREWAGLFPSPLADDMESLDARLAEHPLKPCGPMELASRGFVPPLGADTTAFTHRCGAAVWLTLGGEDKVLPAAVINTELAKRLKAREAQTSAKPGPRARKGIRSDLVMDLLPQAFVKAGRCDAYFDFDRGFLVVDSPSRKRAEQVVSEIRHAAGTFSALPVNAETAPRAVLTGWLAGQQLPEGFALGDTCRLRDAGDEGQHVNISGAELDSEEVQAHIAAGLQCTSLGLTFGGHLSFVIGEDLSIKKLRFLEGAVEAIDAQSHDDVLDELSARFALQVGEIGRLLDALVAAFKISSADTEPSTTAPASNKKARGRKKAGLPPGVKFESVTITHDGESVQLTGEQFANLGRYVDRMVDIVLWMRDNDTASTSALQRYLKCSYIDATNVLEALQEAGVVSAPDDQGTRHLIPFGDA